MYGQIQGSKLIFIFSISHNKIKDFIEVFINISASLSPFDALSNNTIRGAAGGVILLAEYAVKEAYITK